METIHNFKNHIITLNKSEKEYAEIFDENPQIVANNEIAKMVFNLTTIVMALVTLNISNIGGERYNRSRISQGFPLLIGGFLLQGIAAITQL